MTCCPGIVFFFSQFIAKYAPKEKEKRDRRTNSERERERSNNLMIILCIQNILPKLMPAPVALSWQTLRTGNAVEQMTMQGKPALLLLVV